MEERRAHDSTQRRLFAHVEVLKMLVEGFVPAKIMEGLELDLDRAEQMTGKFISHGLAVRESDMLWRIPRKTAGAPLYICLLLELQSSIDPMSCIIGLARLDLRDVRFAHILRSALGGSS